MAPPPIAMLFALSLFLSLAVPCLSLSEEQFISWNSIFSTKLNRSTAYRRLTKEELAHRRELLGIGYWTTNGNAIVDSTGARVWFSGVNWQGFETDNCVVDGLFLPDGGTVGRSIKSHIAQMYLLGFNTIRLAFAGPCMQPDKYPAQSAIDFEVNSELKGKTTLEVLDRIVTLARRKGMRIILDYHRVQPLKGSFKNEPGLWYDDVYNEQYWLDTWKLLAKRYNKNPTVVGMDLFNEPHNNPNHEGPFWLKDGEKPGVNWRTSAKKAADVIQDVNPGVLIFVEGLWCTSGMNQGCWWSSNLTDVKKIPLNLKIPYKLVYSIHDYGPGVYKQPWFTVSNFPNNLPAYWDKLWGFVHDSGFAPIWVGEFGSKLDKLDDILIGTESNWLGALVDYISEKQLVWTWFTWCPNSIDTGGILKADYSSPDYTKLGFLNKIFHPQFGPSQGQLAENVTTKLRAPIGSPPPPPLPPPPPPAPPVPIFNPFTMLSPPPLPLIDQPKSSAFALTPSLLQMFCILLFIHAMFYALFASS